LSVAAIFVVGYVQSAVAEHLTPELDNPAMHVAPNLKPLEPESPAAQIAPNPESLSSEELDNSAMQVLKSFAPQLENPTTQAIPTRVLQLGQRRASGRLTAPNLHRTCLSASCATRADLIWRGRWRRAGERPAAVLQRE